MENKKVLNSRMKNIQFEMQVQGISVGTLAEALGMSRMTLWRWFHHPNLTKGREQRLINALEKIKSDRE